MTNSTLSDFLKLRLSYLLIPCIVLIGCAPTKVPSWGGTAATQSRRVAVAAPMPEAPKLKKLPNGHYRVRKPWTVNLGNRQWIVPAGYTSNGITGPGFIKNSLGDGVQFKETWSAVFHDWLFTQPGITRAQADRLFYELMIAYGVPAEKAKLMYTTVSTYSLTKSNR